jgi:hypothetical protein
MHIKKTVKVKNMIKHRICKKKSKNMARVIFPSEPKISEERSPAEVGCGGGCILFIIIAVSKLICGC